MKVQIFTTATLSSPDLMRILDWKQYDGFELRLLVERKESWIYIDEVKMLVEGGVKVIVYDALEDRNSQLLRKRTPSLRDVWNAFQAEGSKESIYCFVNADIRPKFSRDGKELDIIRFAYENKIILAANRQDYTVSRQSSRVYSKGFDFFSIPGVMLDRYAGLPLEKYRIGQVGWDYALPLMVKRHELFRVSSMGLYHRLHPTGSEEDWGESICRLVSDVDSSWIGSISAIGRTIFRIGKCIQKARVSICPRAVQEFLRYSASRMVYYGAIRAMLRNMYTIKEYEDYKSRHHTQVA